MRLLFIALICVSVLSLTSCSVSNKNTVAFKRPVTQTSQTTTSGQQTTSDTGKQAQVVPSSIAILPFSNQTSEPQAPGLMRQVINSHLAGMNFQVVHPAEVDRRIPVGPVDPKKMASYLGVDAVLMGTVTTYDKFFAGLYAHVSFALDLELVDTQGQVIWTSSQDVTHRSGGISTTPFGILMTAALAAMQLDDTSILSAADELGRKVASAFPQPDGYQHGVGPDIFTVLHDATDKSLSYGQKLVVGIKGEPGQSASVELKGIGVFDLKETAEGEYTRTIFIEPQWNQTDVYVKGRLQSGSGNISTLTSPLGLFDIDNVPPGGVSELSGNLTDKILKLFWEAAEDASEYEVLKQAGDDWIPIATSPTAFITVDVEEPLFAELVYAVVAKDRAGNQSGKSLIRLTAYPQEVGKQRFLTGPLQGDYYGINMLTRTFSPYQVKGEVRFAEDSELYVEPGVELQFGTDATITVNGNAYFWGSRKQIEFKPLGTVSPKLPYLTIDSNKTLQLTGIRMIDPGIGISVANGTLSIDMLEIINSKFSAIALGGQANILLKDCTIDGSNTSGIVVSDFAKLRIEGCTFRNNHPFHMQNASPYAVGIKRTKMTPEYSPTTVLGAVEISQ